MGKPTGFLEYQRVNGKVVSEEERIANFLEFHGMLPQEEQQKQAGRCMDCGVPFCQAGCMILGMMSGCPLHNLVPEINDLVYRGCMEEAYERLSVTHSFPEFTSRVCPALCEAACTCGLHGEPVSTKENEKAVIEYAYAHDLVHETAPVSRTGKRVAVIGSGPAGLACAQLLNRRGHEVTVYERNDRVGGLLRYGIPNMKLDKSVIDRRIGHMEEAGVRFVVNADIGRKKGKADTAPTAEELIGNYDAVVLACGAGKARDINVPGRDAKGIRFAVDFLSEVTKTLLDSGHKDVPYALARDKAVVVIGGGDTGNDCVGTVIRLGASSVIQLEMMPKPSADRQACNPWPEWPRILKTDYGQEESIWKFGQDPRIYQTTVKEFLKNDKGELTAITVVSLQSETDRETKRKKMVEVAGSERTLPADLVLIAAGFTGCEEYVPEAFEVERNERGNVKTSEKKHKTNIEKVYTTGDMHIGQSLVVRAIAEGRSVAAEVDEDLMGYTNL